MPGPTTATMARGLLMPSLLLMPRLSPGIMVDTDMPGHTMEATTMERGLLMLSLLLMLRLSPGTMVDMDTDMPGHTMATSMARGPLMLSLLLMLRLSPGTMVDMDTPGHTMEATTMARGLPILSLL